MVGYALPSGSVTVWARRTAAPGASPGWGERRDGRLRGGRGTPRSARARAYDAALARGDAMMPLMVLAVMKSPPRVGRWVAQRDEFSGGAHPAQGRGDAVASAACRFRRRSARVPVSYTHLTL